VGNEQIVPGKEDFSHDVAIVAIVFEGVFGAQVIEAIGFGMVVMERLPGVLGDHLVTVLNEFKAYIATEFYDVSLFAG